LFNFNDRRTASKNLGWILKTILRIYKYHFAEVDEKEDEEF